MIRTMAKTDQSIRINAVPLDSVHYLRSCRFSKRAMRASIQLGISRHLEISPEVAPTPRLRSAIGITVARGQFVRIARHWDVFRHPSYWKPKEGRSFLGTLPGFQKGPAGMEKGAGITKRTSVERSRCLRWVCAVTRRRFPVGASPTRRTLQPEATGAAMEVTN